MAHEYNPKLPPFTDWGWKMTENGELINQFGRKVRTLYSCIVYIHLSKQHAHVEAEIHVTEEPAIVPVENVYLFLQI